jgi:exodeoxyribonuclease-3
MQLADNPRLVLAGDFNIAPDDRDVHDPAPGPDRSCVRNPSVQLSSACWPWPERQLPPFRAAGEELFVVGLPHARLPEEPGLRIDHILLSNALAERCTAAGISREVRKLERPSDHAPVTAELAD